MKTKSSGIALWILVFLSSLILTHSSFSDIHYVASGRGNISPYTNWGAAAHVIQDAVDAAAPGDTVLVSNGVYGSGGAAIYGMTNRVALTKAVTLKSVNGRDVTSIVGVGPNGPSAVRCLYLTNGASVTGFTLTNGHTQITSFTLSAPPVSLIFSNTGSPRVDSGGGAWLDAGGTISSCTIRANAAYGKGGGIYFSRGGAVWNSLIKDNLGSGATHGGGVYIEEEGWLLNSQVVTNSVSGMGMAGGVYCKNGGVVSNCVISGNRSSIIAGMMCVGGGLITDSVIEKNVNTISGYGFTGGLSINTGVTVERCIIAGNSAGSDGGGIRMSGGTVRNCMIRDNEVTGDSASSIGGGGVYISGGLLESCQILDNEASGYDSYGNEGGGIYMSGGIVRNCVISDNSARQAGGGVYALGGVIENCLFYDNAGAYGGGVFCAGDTTVRNATIVGNWAGNGGGIYWLSPLTLTVQNSIIYSNFASIGDANWDGHAEAAVSFIRSCTTPISGLPGNIGCIEDDPKFVDVLIDFSHVINSNFHLKASSPCIDAGTNLVGVVDDIEGTGRPLDGDNDGSAITDIGAYEFCHASADTDGDTQTDLEEYISQTDGADGDDFFMVSNMSINSPITMRFDSSASRDYTLIMSEDLVGGIWTNVPGMGPRAGVDGADAFVVTNDNPKGNYSVRVEMP